MKGLAPSITCSCGCSPYAYTVLTYKSITVYYYQDWHVNKTLRIWEPFRSTAHTPLPTPYSSPLAPQDMSSPDKSGPAGTPALGL